MENVIREGELHTLRTESQCDVVLSCKGDKLMAHKIILSIASPILQGLLQEDTTDKTVLIFPDVDGSVMSLVLHYIYNGNVTIPSYKLSEFLSTVALLKLQLDHDYSESDLCDGNKSEILERGSQWSEKKLVDRCKSLIKEECGKKLTRRIPNLMPIAALRGNGNGIRKGLYNRVFPSPWCPRVVPLLADPRDDHTVVNDPSSFSTKKDKYSKANDTNNNLKINSLQLSSHIAADNVRKDTNLVTANSPTPISDLTTKEPNKENKCAENLTTYNNPDVCVDSIKVEKEEENSLNNCPSRISSNESKALDQKTDKQKPFKCQDCGKLFSQLRNYKYHRSIHEGTKEFSARCPECGKIFNDKGYLSSHLKIHRDRKEYACPNCPKRFNQRVAYNMHMRIHTGLKPHECPTCGKSFSRKMLLKQHQRVHTGERPYSCPECGKSFADRSNMSLHTRLHSGVKPYECNLCSKSFTKKHHLKTHMNFHTGLKPYSCEKCGLSFSQSSNMRTHFKKCILKTSPQAS
ncbi:hypothetical protein PPYR_08201 [Photinus pyralis]|uniref:BTB domain-containing protein n=2 Tax=Photinus pyralis TaxID=7054 RepID=A0A5N4AIQ5_PHOPY|nr:zinc finger protein interacting with ribonucleoprotein K-like [Photinus pyralis]XP_031345796.1 zinc finger protein interacting with ribonucleoprotein K-like [Photinus pyralis]XP_031345797.1 zinc finger protein interacting with ribonucleoprotein K-like [Photinus pyralis]XP_031345798.1 zinc finger protein interacting with ribonucleoprotein K-like [Photinus pyralis]XP_031345799.1 zinc finger protein interacting with ribonucleoprotein K-like [Photinus pyralis]KAB0797207.1 hypothetical protein P